MAKAPSRIEIARVTGGRDITRGWVDGQWWQQPQDRVLVERGGGDYLLYEDLLRDDRVWSAHQQRRAAVVARETQVLPGGKTARDKRAARQLEEILEALPWDEITDKMLYATLYGWAVAEVMWTRDGRYVAPERVLVRNQRRFAWRAEEVPPSGMRWRLLLRTTSDAVGEPAPDRKFWTAATGASNSDEPYGRGLGHALYWPVWFKRNQLEFWLVALEKFGMPTPVGKLPPSASDADRKKLVEAVQAVHSDAGVVIPDTALIELLERSAGTMDYDSFYRRMDQAITQVILSETMTTEDGSSRSQAEVHMDVREEIVEADAWLIHDSFRRQVARWLVDWNFPGAAAPIIRRVREEHPDLNRQAERDVKIVEMTGRNLSERYVVETYGVDLVEERMPARLAPPGGPGDADGDDGAADLAAWRNRRLARPGSASLAAARPRLDAVEQVMAAIDDEAWDEVAAPIIEPILRRARENPEALLSDLASVWPEMSVDALAEKLARILFVARIWGRLEQQEEQQQ